MCNDTALHTAHVLSQRFANLLARLQRVVIVNCQLLATCNCNYDVGLGCAIDLRSVCNVRAGLRRKGAEKGLIASYGVHSLI